MRYILLAVLFSSVAFGGNGSGWGGKAFTLGEMQALREPLIGLVLEDEVFLRSQEVQELIQKTELGIPVALSIDDKKMLVRPIEFQNRLELETPDGERVLIRPID